MNQDRVRPVVVRMGVGGGGTRNAPEIQKISFFSHLLLSQVSSATLLINDRCGWNVDLSQLLMGRCQKSTLDRSRVQTAVSSPLKCGRKPE